MEITVLNLNLRFGRADDGPNSWPHRQAAYPLLFDRFPADFIHLQEANDFQIDDLKTLLSDHDVIGIRKPAPAFWQSDVIFYHNSWTCAWQDHFYLSHTPDVPSRFARSRWPRQCTVGIFERGTMRLASVNTHFDFDEAVQEHSARLILKRLNDATPDLPTVLTGDFNAGPDSAAYGVFTAPEANAGFKNAFMSPYPATVHGFTGTTDGDHIDWILFRGEVRPLQSKVVQERFEGIYPSDHYPMVCRFKFLPASPHH